MALAINNIVSPHLETVGVHADAQSQPPWFGIVEDYGDGNADVLWQDGQLVASIDENSLDLIGAPVANALTGQRVMINVSPGAAFQASADYQGVVLNLYTRDPAGGGEPSATLALVKLISSGAYLEVLASECQVVGSGS